MKTLIEKKKAWPTDTLYPSSTRPLATVTVTSEKTLSSETISFICLKKNFKTANTYINFLSSSLSLIVASAFTKGATLGPCQCLWDGILKNHRANKLL